MKWLVVAIIFFLSFLFLNYSHAKTGALTLSQALQEAETGSLELQKVKSEKNEAAWKSAEAFSGFLPHVSLLAQKVEKQRYPTFNAPMFGPNDVPQIYPSASLTLQAEYPLFDGFASTNRFLAGRQQKAAADKKWDWAQFTNRRKVILQYYQALASQTLKEVAVQNLKTLQDHEKDVKNSQKAGVATKFDTLRVEVQMSEAESEILNATDNVESAKNQLAAMLGKETEDRELQGNLPVLDSSLADQANLESAVQRQDVQAKKDMTESLRYLNKASSRFWVPQVSLYGQYQYYNNRSGETGGFSDSDKFRDAYQIGFNLKWNLFDGMISAARAGQASEKYFQADRDLQITRIRSKQEFDFWKRKFRYFTAVYKARVSDLAKATESVRLARIGRRAGVRTNTDLLDAELELFRARAGVVNAQVGAIEALVNLEMATGLELYKF